MADALLIGSVGGGELWARAQKEYMRRQPRPYMKLVAAVMERDLAGRDFLGRVMIYRCTFQACLHPSRLCPGHQAVGVSRRACARQDPVPGIKLSGSAVTSPQALCCSTYDAVGSDVAHQLLARKRLCGFIAVMPISAAAATYS